MTEILKPILELLLAVVLGGVVGWQRHHTGKAAGVRTYALVSFGAAFFTIISLSSFGQAETARVVGQIITGIGFLGAGAIIHKGMSVEGLTTAAGLWAVAAVGVGVGVGNYIVSTLATLLMFLILLSKRPRLG